MCDANRLLKRPPTGRQARRKTQDARRGGRNRSLLFPAEKIAGEGMKIDPPTKAVADMIADHGYAVPVRPAQVTATDKKTDNP